MIVLEFVGWIVLGFIVGYYSFDFSKVDRYSKSAYAAIGAIGSVAGGFLGYALSRRPLLGEWTFNAAAAGMALVCAVGAVVVATVIRRHGRPARRAG